MRKSFASTGSVGRVSPESNVLKSNMLGDPSMPVVDVCLPGTAVLQLDLFWLGLPFQGASGPIGFGDWFAGTLLKGSEFELRSSAQERMIFKRH